MSDISMLEALDEDEREGSAAEGSSSPRGEPSPEVPWPAGSGTSRVSMPWGGSGLASRWSKAKAWASGVAGRATSSGVTATAPLGSASPAQQRDGSTTPGDGLELQTGLQTLPHGQQQSGRRTATRSGTTRVPSKRRGSMVDVAARVGLSGAPGWEHGGSCCIVHRPPCRGTECSRTSRVAASWQVVGPTRAALPLVPTCSGHPRRCFC